MNRQIPVTPPNQPPRFACLGGCLLLFLPFALGVIVLVLFLAENDPPSSNPPTVGELLATLDERITSDGLTVTVQLSVPVNGQTALTLDGGSLDTIQDEYFCIRQTRDDSATRVCIPYANIASITHPDA